MTLNLMISAVDCAGSGADRERLRIDSSGDFNFFSNNVFNAILVGGCSYQGNVIDESYLDADLATETDVNSATGGCLQVNGTGLAGNFQLGNYWLSGDGGNEGVFVDSDGDIGIGTNNPNDLLELSHNAPSIEFFERDGTVNTRKWCMVANDDSFYFNARNDAESAQTGIMEVNRSASTVTKVKFPTGDVGIGTAPTERLEVAGNVKATAFIGDGSQLTGIVGVPSGAILMWSGSATNIPSGWALCNGATGTPDLRDRFIVGAGSTYSVGDVGGAINHTHGAGSYQAPAHSHAYSGNTSRFGNTREAGAAPPKWGWALGESDHRHSYSGQTGDAGGGSIAGNSESASSLPPYYALCYIIRL